MRASTLVVVWLVLAAAPAGAAASPVLTPLAETAGCLLGPAQARLLARTGCGRARGLGSTQHVRITPDGRFAYAISNDTWSVEAFRRDVRSGRVTQLPGSAGCVADASRPIPGCATARGLVWGFDLTLTADGGRLLATGGIGNALAAFSRDPVSGVLTQTACLRDTTGGDARGGPSPAASGCTLVDGLRYPRGVASTPDGRFAYVAAFGEAAITGFALDAAGGLSPAPGACAARRRAGCAEAALSGVTGVAISADGRFLYASAFKGASILAFAIDPASGALTTEGCVGAGAGCVPARGLSGVYDLALSPDGHQLYAAARLGGSGVAVLQRDPATGALRQLPGRAGCVAEGGRLGCAPGVGLRGVRGIAVAPDGRAAYAGAFSSSAVTAFARDPRTGALRQTGCVALRRSPGCVRGPRSLRQAWAVAVSPDGRFVVGGVGGDGTSGLTVLRAARART